MTVKIESVFAVSNLKHNTIEKKKFWNFHTAREKYFRNIKGEQFLLLFIENVSRGLIGLELSVKSSYPLVVDQIWSYDITVEY